MSTSSSTHLRSWAENIAFGIVSVLTLACLIWYGCDRLFVDIPRGPYWAVPRQDHWFIYVYPDRTTQVIHVTSSTSDKYQIVGIVGNPNTIRNSWFIVEVNGTRGYTPISKFYTICNDPNSTDSKSCLDYINVPRYDEEAFYRKNPNR